MPDPSWMAGPDANEKAVYSMDVEYVMTIRYEDDCASTLTTDELKQAVTDLLDQEGISAESISVVKS